MKSTTKRKLQLLDSILEKLESCEYSIHVDKLGHAVIGEGYTPKFDLFQRAFDKVPSKPLAEYFDEDKEDKSKTINRDNSSEKYYKAILYLQKNEFIDFNKDEGNLSINYKGIIKSSEGFVFEYRENIKLKKVQVIYWKIGIAVSIIALILSIISIWIHDK